MRRLLPFLLCTGCFIGNDIVPLVDGTALSEESGEGLISCSPASIDFGELRVVEGELASSIIQCTNPGEVDLKILDVAFADDTAVYSVSAPSATLLPAGASMQLSVTYAPMTDATDVASLVITSTAPEPVGVALVGDGIAPKVAVTPEVHDFGVLEIGCESTQDITITNEGRDVLLVDGVSFQTGSTDLLTDADGQSWTLEPGDATTIAVTYAPLDEFEDASWLLIDSNDPFVPTAMATQGGEGALAGENTDIYEQPLTNATDILFAVDKSGSMSDDLLNVQNNFAAYTSTLDSLNADYRIAIIVMDSGAVYGATPFIDPDNAADAVDIAQTMLSAPAGVNTERGFTLLEAALGQADWLRPEASLHLVGISDEPEQSASSYSYYIEAFQSLKDDPDAVTIHAIGGDYPGGCATAEPYMGFYEASVATDGLFLSLCAVDWGAHLAELAEATTATLETFALSEWPVEETIEVVVDDQQVYDGWRYDSAENAVYFEAEAVPEGGAIVEIHYAVSGDCDQ